MVAVGDIDQEVVDAPFLMAAMFLMVSSDFEMLQLAQMVVRAGRVRWNTAGTEFTPIDSMQRVPVVGYKVDSSEGLGSVTIRLRRDSIAYMGFERA